MFKVDHGHKLRKYDVKRLEEVFQFRYLPKLQCDNYKIEQWLRNKCQWAYKRGYIDKLTIWLGTLHGKALDAGYIPDVTVKWIHPDIGYGLFTNQPIKKWEFIGEYGGIVRRRNLVFRNINDYCFMYPREWIALKAFAIDSQAEGNLLRFVNHADTPNLESLSVYHDGLFHIIFRATREIKVGEELNYDYGGIYWNHRRKVSSIQLEKIK